MKRLIALIFVSLLSTPAAAQIHTGVITQVRVDSVAGIGVCVETSPELRDVAAACVYANRPYYQEMRELVWRAFETAATCTLEWNQVDAMTHRARIEVITCSLPRR